MRLLVVPTLILFGIPIALFYPEALPAYVIASIVSIMYLNKKRTKDERDLEVEKRAAALSYFITMAAFTIAFVSVSFGVGLKEAVSTAFFVGVFSYWVAQAYYYSKFG